MNYKTIRFYASQWLGACLSLYLFVLFALQFLEPPRAMAVGYPTPTPPCSITPMPTSSAVPSDGGYDLQVSVRWSAR